jgi:hypothetical protein
MSFSRRVSSTWTLTGALLQGKLARDGIPLGLNSVPPRALSHGHQGQRQSLTSSVAESPQVGINAGHGLDPARPKLAMRVRFPSFVYSASFSA